jgi:hypothetical protein
VPVTQDEVRIYCSLTVSIVRLWCHRFSETVYFSKSSSELVLRIAVVQIRNVFQGHFFMIALLAGGWNSRSAAHIVGGQTYGSLANPWLEPGSGGGSNHYTWEEGRGGDGGGALGLTARLVFVNGTLSANGGNGLYGRYNYGGYGGGGGSGGSIVLNVTHLTGAGLISANGGNGGGSGGGSVGAPGGGGGRVALYPMFDEFEGTVTAFGGLKTTNPNRGNGAGGTVYRREVSTGVTAVSVDNRGTAVEGVGYAYTAIAASDLTQEDFLSIDFSFVGRSIVRIQTAAVTRLLFSKLHGSADSDVTIYGNVTAFYKDDTITDDLHLTVVGQLRMTNLTVTNRAALAIDGVIEATLVNVLNDSVVTVNGGSLRVQYLLAASGGAFTTTHVRSSVVRNIHVLEYGIIRWHTAVTELNLDWLRIERGGSFAFKVLNLNADQVLIQEGGQMRGTGGGHTRGTGPGKGAHYRESDYYPTGAGYGGRGPYSFARLK